MANETAAAKKKREAAEAKAAQEQNQETGVAAPNQWDFKIEEVDEDTGEVMIVDKFRYVEGYPRGFRCDAKTGTFGIMEGAKLEGNKFTFQPIAWRFFKDDIMKLGLKNWAEVFFIDQWNNVGVILFHSATAENLERLSMPLFYERISLMDCVITCEMKEHVNKKITPNAKYWIGEFSYEKADPENVKEMKAYVKTVKLYRRSTVSETAEVKAQNNFFNPFEQPDFAELEEINEDS